ncbi:hypothetical protein Poly30_37340 [Planctomycetes bacterium Poly30]|uniref:Flagellar hook-associated protein 2 C-terminal domain-containing protein n=1 Tax=Saltatorellus ferox TaxID=2528018 RepID=A0A518EVW2_9BACT|nr:hypothetical protein Poly30_37340 [Planctomycetes bacterium Poly30]
MRVGGTAGAWTPFARPFGSTLNIGSAGARGGAAAAGETLTLSALSELAGDVDVLGEAVRKLGRLDRVSSRTVGARAGMATGQLVLDDTEVPASAATMRSVEEVNTVATSYSTHAPDWTGGSAAGLGIEGVYDGRHGDTTLNFEVTGVPLLGLTSAEIEVTDGSGDLIETLTFGSGGGTQTLASGLEFTLGSGALTLGDTFALDVSASVGTSVRASAAFDGTGDAAPEFDPGRSVSAGTFVLNGVSIDVAASESLLDVLDSINASSAGVTAQFDATTERVTLSQNTVGAAPTILFGSDISGFLDAVKLRGAVATAGEDAASAESADDVIGSLASLSGVTSGSFQVNGQTISVDIANDTLPNVLARISASGEVNAMVDDARAVTLAGRGRRAFDLSGDDTGLLGALGIDLQRYAGTRGRQTTTISNRAGVRRALLEVHDAYNALLRGPRDGVSATNVREVRSRLSTSVGSAFSRHQRLSGSGTLVSGLGLNLSAFDDTKTRAMELDSAALAKALRAKDGELSDLLFGSEEGKKGLVEFLEEAVKGAAESLVKKLDPGGALGLRLDVTG